MEAAMEPYQYRKEELEDSAEFNWSIISFISKLLEKFGDGRDERASILNILQWLGEIYQVDRVYICRFSKDRTALECELQWCRDGISPARFAGEVDAERVIRLFENMGLVVCGAVSQLQDGKLRQHLEAYGVQSALAYLFVKNGEVSGWIGLDDCHRKRGWRTEEIEVLQAAAILLRERTASWD